MKSPQDFADSFGLPQNGFEAASLFADGFGFSTFKARQQVEGRLFASLYKFYISPDELGSVGNVKDIKISASYGEKIPEGLSLTPRGIKRKPNWPRDIFIHHEFSYNIANGDFAYKSKSITATDILKRVDAHHMLPNKTGLGFPFRFLQSFKQFELGILNFLYWIQGAFLWMISGTITEKKILDLPSRFGNEIRILPFAQEKIKIFGYEASAWSVVVYSTIHAGIYVLWYLYFLDADISFFTIAFQNIFLTASYVIPSIVLFERILPKTILGTMKYTSKAYTYMAFH